MSTSIKWDSSRKGEVAVIHVIHKMEFFSLRGDVAVIAHTKWDSSLRGEVAVITHTK